MENKFSIIVPVYNAEKYILECLESIANQENANFEVILINDGSTDNSKIICEKFCQKDKRFKLINQDNLGVSKTRNRALQLVTGKYIIFVDADDILKKNALKEIFEHATNKQLVCYGYTKMYKNKNENENVLLIDSTDDFNKIEREIVLENSIGGYLWNKMFLTSIIKKNNIQFKEDINYCEDLLFVAEYLSSISKVIYINKSLYYYRMRKNSLTYNFFNSNEGSILKAYSLLIEWYKDKKEFYWNLQLKYLVFYNKLKNVIKNKNDIDINIINNEKNILKNNKLNIKTRIKYKIIKEFNFIYLILKRIKDKNEKMFE